MAKVNIDVNEVLFCHHKISKIRAICRSAIKRAVEDTISPSEVILLAEIKLIKEITEEAV